MQLNLSGENNPFNKAREAFKSKAPEVLTFEQHKEKFENSTLGKQAKKAFTPVPYEVENRAIYTTAGVVSYACQVVSVTAAASFVFAFVLSRINTLPGAWYVSFGIAAAALFCIEYLLRKETPKLARTVLIGGLSANLWRRGLFVLVLTAAGIASSYLGGFDTAAAVADNPPAYVAPSDLTPTLLDAEEIRQRYSVQIADAKAAAKEYKTRRLYRGKISIADGNKYRNLLAVVTEKENAMNAEIKAAAATNTAEREKIRAENKQRTSAAKDEHGEAVAAYQNRIDQNGGGLAWLSVVAQFIFFCCVGFRSHYLIETAKQYASSAPTDGGDIDPNGGGNRSKNAGSYSTELEDILKAQTDANGEIYNGAKMRVLRGGKSAQSELQIDATDANGIDANESKTVFVPTSLTVEHIDRTSRKIKRLNITQVRGNLSANRTRLRKAKESGADAGKIENIAGILRYWSAKEDELINAAADIEKSAAVG